MNSLHMKARIINIIIIVIFHCTCMYSMFLVDALFAVYEASSLELWYFMSQAAINGGARSVGHISIFYFTLVFFLVFLVQVRIIHPVTCAGV